MNRRSLFLLVFSAGLAAGQVPPAAGADDGAAPAPRALGEAIDLLETWIGSMLDFDRLPGISIAVVHDQEIVYAGGFGYADVESGLRATPDTHYSICSISKIFTGIAVMQLRDEGKLSLNDPVSRHLPWFPAEAADSAGAAPSLGDLLRHSSGLPCEPDMTVWSDPERLSPSREALIERIAGLKMSYPVNTQFNYSNLGYALLGEVVSVVSGMTYEDYVRRNIIEPLGLEETTPSGSGGDPGEPLAVGYGRWPRRGSRVKMPLLQARSMTPALGFCSTATDLAKFAMWQFRVLDGEDPGVLSRESLQEMLVSQWPDPEWGFGFARWNMGGKEFIGHQGGCPGYKSQFILCPEEKIAVVAMVNATDGPQFTLVFRAYEILSAALLDSQATEDDGGREWAPYTGYYTADKSWSDAEVLEWGGALAVMWVPTGDPVGSLIKLKRLEGDVFRQVNGDGSLGKHYVFARDADNGTVRMKFNNNVLTRTPHLPGPARADRRPPPGAGCAPSCVPARQRSRISLLSAQLTEARDSRSTSRSVAVTSGRSPRDRLEA